MPAYSKEREQLYKDLIREVHILIPDASAERVREELAKRKVPITLDRHYITKLTQKILKEEAHRFDNKKLKTRLARAEDELKQVKARLWQILAGPDHSAKDKVAAAKGIIDAEMKFIHALTIAGIFDERTETSFLMIPQVREFLEESRPVHESTMMIIKKLEQQKQLTPPENANSQEQKNI